jgi:hypothetical protein
MYHARGDWCALTEALSASIIKLLQSLGRPPRAQAPPLKSRDIRHVPEAALKIESYSTWCRRERGRVAFICGAIQDPSRRTSKAEIADDFGSGAAKGGDAFLIF